MQVYPKLLLNFLDQDLTINCATSVPERSLSVIQESLPGGCVTLLGMPLSGEAV